MTRPLAAIDRELLEHKCQNPGVCACDRTVEEKRRIQATWAGPCTRIADLKAKREPGRKADK
jgi:hypothetical protein